MIICPSKQKIKIAVDKDHVETSFEEWATVVFLKSYTWSQQHQLGRLFSFSRAQSIRWRTPSPPPLPVSVPPAEISLSLINRGR